ncbi:hypothetical protein [Amycolatopsis sp. 195334CR]|uniref:hypothetical protein n=1 Tax=Amycolatopsis sp. 195334CR TaxID=2814588 RepID=UPI001A8CFF45|nr:hypothetical protein [Amycolatopsis sp. 195334CR]MBN6035541.1 hypothetical protein [Amycolatopsis sp. 195334CR]
MSDDEEAWSLADSWDYGDEPAAAPAPETGGPPVTVTGSRVRLAPDWRERIDPRSLHTEVVTAANQAAAEAALRNPAPVREPVRPDPATDPITPADALRLLDSVQAELDAFARQVAAFDHRPEWVDSEGGHVSGSSAHGAIREFEIDAKWARSAPNTEIEAELTEVLTRLHDKDDPAALLTGPQTPAVAELRALTADPRALLRRVGLLKGPSA